MERKKAIAPKYLPSRIPLWPTLLIWLLLDRFNHPPLAWGALGLFLVVWWGAAFVGIWVEDWVKPGEVE